MKLIVILIVGVLALSVQNVLLSRLRLSAPVAMLGNVFMLVLAAGLSMTQGSLKWPRNQHEWVLWTLAGCLLMVTAYCVTYAYSHGASATTVTSVTALTPLFATIIQTFVMRKLPDFRECVAMMLAISALYILALKR